MSRPLLALAVCAALLGTGGCGGGSDDTASTSPATSEATATPGAVQPSPQSTAAKEKADESAKQDAGKPSASAAKGEGSGQQQSNDSKQSPKPVKVPPISSAPVAGSEAPAPGVKTVAGADNSVQEYGVEAGEAARREAAIALQAYLDARLREDWASACAALAQKPLQQLQRVERSAAKQGKDLDGCPATMALLSEGIPRSQRLEEATVTEVLSFRGGGDIPGNPSYLIFTGPPGKTLYSMPMYLQGAGWKVGLGQRAPLPVG